MIMLRFWKEQKPPILFLPGNLFSFLAFEPGLKIIVVRDLGMHQTGFRESIIENLCKFEVLGLFWDQHQSQVLPVPITDSIARK